MDIVLAFLAISISICALALAWLGQALVSGICRNPESRESAFIPGLLALGMIEVLALVLAGVLAMKSM